MKNNVIWGITVPIIDGEAVVAEETIEGEADTVEAVEAVEAAGVKHLQVIVVVVVVAGTTRKTPHLHQELVEIHKEAQQIQEEEHQHQQLNKI